MVLPMPASPSMTRAAGPVTAAFSNAEIFVRSAVRPLIDPPVMT